MEQLWPRVQPGDVATVVQELRSLSIAKNGIRRTSVHGPGAECVCPDGENSVVPLARVMKVDQRDDAD